MNNRAEILVPALIPFLPQGSAQDQRVFKLIQALQSYQGSSLPNIIRGVLTYWLTVQPKKNKYSSLLKLSWLFGSKPTLDEIIQKELGVNEKKPLDNYQKLIYLSALLSYLLKNPGEEDRSLLARELITWIHALLTDLTAPITALLKTRPRGLALARNLSMLLSGEKEKKEGAEFSQLLTSTQQVLIALLPKDPELAYDAAFGAVVYIMSQLDRATSPHIYTACQNAINVDELSEVAPDEKLSCFLALSYVLSKSPASRMRKQLQLSLNEQMNDLLQERQRCGSLKKVIFFAADNVNQALSYYLNPSMRHKLKQAGSYLSQTLRGLNYLGEKSGKVLGSACSFFYSSKASAFLSPESAYQKEFVFALSSLPNLLFSEAEKRRLHNAFEIEAEQQLQNQPVEEERADFKEAPLALSS